MPFIIKIPSISGEPVKIELQSGSSAFFVGANGSGKTRLAAYIENELGEKAHRIAAHRSLALDPKIQKIGEDEARNSLRFGAFDTNVTTNNLGNIIDGYDPILLRKQNRWGNKAETHILNDFDSLVQTLFAEQSNVTLQTYNAAFDGLTTKPEQTMFRKLRAIWGGVLPRRLDVTGDDIKVNADGQPSYSASEMSDGERSVFYMLGQALVAEPNSVLIFDEPELHIHRAILGRLWDEIETARPDCAFLVITHDLEFVASRVSEKFIIRRYQAPNQWEIEQVPEDTGFDEETATLILGSRAPVLFVEGDKSSLDQAIYRACYPGFTVVPLGSCKDVIHAVATMRKHKSLNRVTCSGIVDADGRDAKERQILNALGVELLPVSEIENLFLLPDIAKAILEKSYQGEKLQDKLGDFKQAVLDVVNEPKVIDDVVLRYCRRRIDKMLKGIDLKAATTEAELVEIYADRTAALNVNNIAKEARERIEGAIREGDLPTLLIYFDNKGLFAEAATKLRDCTRDAFESWLMRTVHDPEAIRLRAALDKVLPKIAP